MRLYFDIEADGLLDTLSRAWCICAKDLDSKQEWSFGPDRIPEALSLLGAASLLVAHNAIGYDLPALMKLYDWRFGGIVRDTLILARLRFPNLKQTDPELVARGTLPKRLVGSDSLEAWGHRVGIQKSEYSGGFTQWSQEMQDYCLQDVRTGEALWRVLDEEAIDQRAVEVEHRVAHICHEMEQAGWPFDVAAAQRLYARLKDRKGELESLLLRRFGSWRELDRVFVPKRDNRALGYQAGVEVRKYKTVSFNPGSRRHIEKKLRELGWKPTALTPTGLAKLDEEILEDIDIPEAQQIIEYLLIQKRIGQVAEGENAWLKLVREGMLHPRYNTLGTVTGRASHHRPNVAQTPAVRSKKGGLMPYGAECRECWIVPPGWKLVGADQESLELRCLSSYLAYWDGGDYGRIVCDGDVHTMNQEAAALPSRDTAKTFIYAWLYGAGDAKIGSIVGRDSTHGAYLKRKFLDGLPALEELLRAVARAASRGYIIALDGRHIPIRAEHAALNSLLQGAGAIICKRWLSDAYDALLSSGLRWGWEGDFVIVCWIHDELQVACREAVADEVGKILVGAARNAGRPYDFRCRLDSKYVIGTNWKETH